MLALETTPSALEARVLAQLLAEFPGVVAWLSFSCRDGVSISDGTRFADAVRIAEASPGITAVGVNCTAPEHVGALLGGARTATRLPFVVYPNDGRTWDASRRAWSGGGAEGFSRSAIDRWRQLGATMIGGCCGVGPATITRVAATLGRARIEREADTRYT
jgi:homocysteine S-methyltransferase